MKKMKIACSLLFIMLLFIKGPVHALEYEVIFPTDYWGYCDPLKIHAEITDSWLELEIRKISGTFQLSGTFELRWGGFYGSTIDTQSYNAGASSVTLDTPLYFIEGEYEVWAVLITNVNQYACYTKVRSRLSPPQIFEPGNYSTDVPTDPTYIAWIADPYSDTSRIQIATINDFDEETGLNNPDLNEKVYSNYYYCYSLQPLTQYWLTIRSGHQSSIYQSRYCQPIRFTTAGGVLDPADLDIQNGNIPAPVPANGGTWYLYVKNLGESTLAWNVDSSTVPTWLTVSPTSGSINADGQKSVYIQVNQNVTSVNRSCNLRFYNTSNTSDDANFPLAQSGNATENPDIDLSPSSIVFYQSETNSAEDEEVQRSDRTSIDIYEERNESDLCRPITGDIPPDILEHWKGNQPLKQQTEKNLPATLDWSSFDSGIRHQGTNCGSCAVHAALAGAENYINRTGLNFSDNLSEQILMSCTNIASCFGGWPISVLQYVRDIGIEAEDCYPYQATDNAPCSNKCIDAPKVKIAGCSDYYGLWGDSDFTVEDIKRELQDGPLVVSMKVSDSFFTYSGGIFDYSGPDLGWTTNAHAVLLTGYNDAGYFTAKNSWGTNWGENGYFRIDYSDIDQAGIAFGSYAAKLWTPYIASEEKVLNISNIGPGNLTIYGIAVNRSWLNFSPDTLPEMGPGTTNVLTLSVNWNALSGPTDTATLAISCNDPDESVVQVSVTALTTQSGGPPELSVHPAYFEFDDFGGTGSIIIDNIGSGDFVWNAISTREYVVVENESGTNEDTLVFNVDANLYPERQAEIIINAPDALNSPAIVTIIQNAATEDLILSNITIPSGHFNEYLANNSITATDVIIENSGGVSLLS
ncbi:MAG: hypothetical protein JW702_11735, partial [Clostridiales bacterium]|nr:hypothetical protein [Clostridiales bacterium]